MRKKLATMESFLAQTKGKGNQNLVNIVQDHFSDEALVNEILYHLEYVNASEKSHSLCQKLFDIFSCGSRECAVFVIQFLPALIWAYLSQGFRLTKSSSPGAETLLLAIYNKAVNRYIEAPYEKSFRIPSISKPSMYHEPSISIGKSPALTEHNLKQYEKSETPLFAKGATEIFDRLPAGVRSTVLATCLEEFNKYISFYSISSLDSLCRLVARMSCCGTTWRPENVSALLTHDEVSVMSSREKIHVPGEVVGQLVSSLYFCMCNGRTELAQLALSCLRRKSMLSLSTSDVMNSRALDNIVELSGKDSSRFCSLPPVRMHKLLKKEKPPLSSLTFPEITRVGVEDLSLRTPRSPPRFGQHLRPPQSVAGDTTVDQLEHVYEVVGDFSEFSVAEFKDGVSEVAISVFDSPFDGSLSAATVREVELAHAAVEHCRTDSSLILPNMLACNDHRDRLTNLQVISSQSVIVQTESASAGVSIQVPVVQIPLVHSINLAISAVGKSSENLTREVMVPLVSCGDRSRLIVCSKCDSQNSLVDADSPCDGTVRETVSFSDDKRANSIGEHELASVLTSRSDKERKRSKGEADDSLNQKRCAKPHLTDATSQVTVSSA